jgi:hypothetical protein
MRFRKEDIQMTKSTKPMLQVQLTTLVTGLQALVGVDTFVLANKTYAKADIILAINAYLAALNAENAALAQYQTAVSTAKAAKGLAVSLRALLRAFFVNRLGKGNAQLVSLSFGPVPKTPTVATKSTAVAKAEATRTARHTLGKKQKLAIKAPVPSTIAATPSLATPQNGVTKPSATT